MSYLSKKSNQYLLLSILIWSIIITISTITQNISTKQTIIDIAENQTRVAYEKDVLYRKWASSHGGVYVPVTELTQPNPGLSHIPERDIQTPSGIKLTLVNPAYMTRQVHEMGADIYQFKGRITSLNPINIINTPDEWESKALRLFETGVTEVTEVVEEDGVKILKYMNALVTEESCLKCHAIQGYKVGEIRGGLGVSLSLKELEDSFKDTIRFEYITHFTIWFIGLITILFISRILKKRIREQKEYIKKLALSKSHEEKEKQSLSITLGSIGEGVITTDMNGVVTRMNNIAQELTGWNLLDARNREISTVFKITDVHDSNQNIPIRDMVLKSNTPIKQNYYLTCRSNNNKFLIHNTGSKIIGEDKKELGIVLVFRDKTADQQIQEKLIQSQNLDAIGQLSNGISHNFNNMISGIIGGTELLQLHLVEDEKSQKYLSLIKEACLRASDLTTKLISFSKSQKIDLKPLDVHNTIDAAISLLDNTIDKSIKIDAQLNAKKSTIIGDLTQLQNVFINLGINSYHAMPNGGKLSFITKNVILNEAGKLEQEFIEIEVTDDGSGIPVNILSNIFNPFFTTKEQGKGSGLGLSVIYGTVEKLKGSIRVNSVENDGTTFTLLFPVSQEPIKYKKNKTLFNYHGKGHILLVDDEEILRTLGKDILENLGFQVVLAINGKDALEKFKTAKSPFNLIILDMMMPIMNGRECLKNIRKLDTKIPVIISSGFSNEEDIEEIKKMGCEGILSKPFSISKMSKIISELI
ncbi:MAG: response regulator [Spirochaetaceae bacterium]